jgi:mono/diheme cytochrome c family protein
MKKSRMFLAMIAAGVFAVPLFGANKADSAAGKAVFMKRCSSCHGPDGAGKEAIAKMFKVEMHALGSKEVQAKSDADLKKIVADGTGKMKPVKDLSPQDMNNLIAFVRSLAKK